MGVAAPPLLSGLAWADTYPSRPVRIMVGFAAGGPNDILARLVGQWCSERLGQQFIVENRPGAGSNIATDAVVRAPPDGYTLLLVGSPNAINATLYENLDFNFLRDIAPVAGLTRGALVMVIHPSVPANTIPEFIAYAKANPGKLSYGSGGVGGITHIAAELFKQEAGGLDLQHVPYRGVAPAITDLLGGQVQVVFVNLAPSIGYIGSGKLRALGITTAARSEALPDVPAICEFVPGMRRVQCLASVRRKTRQPRLSTGSIRRPTPHWPIPGSRCASVASMLRDSAARPPISARSWPRETEKWAKVMSLAKIRLE